MNRLLIAVLFVFVILGSYFLWRINQVPPIRAWDLVPADALIVYEQNKTAAEGTDWVLKPFLTDSIRTELLASKELLVSLHLLGKQDIGTVAFASGSEKFMSILKSSRTFKERVFEGYKIVEVSGPNKKILSAVIIERVFVVGSAPYLVEDVIRIARSRERTNFAGSNSALFRFAKMDSEGGRIFVNLSQLPGLFSLLSVENNQPIQSRIARSAVLDVKRQEGLLLFNGFALDSLATEGSLLPLFNRQSPVHVTLQKVISNRTGLLLHFGISDFGTLNRDRLAFCSALRMPVADSIDGLKERYGFDSQHFYQQLGDEIGICRGGAFSNDVLVIELKDRSAALSDLGKLRPKVPVDSLAGERYAQVDILPLTVPSLPTTLFWPLCNHTMKFYSFTDGHLIMAEEVDDLKAFIDDIDAENIWSKSPEWNKFLSNSQETNMGVIVDGPNGWPYIRQHLSSKWQLIGDSVNFLNVNKASFQFSRLEKNFYVNGILQFNPNSTTAREKEKTTEVSTTQSLAGQLTIVKNHNVGGNELIGQDQDNHLLLFSSRLKQLFSTPLTGRITSDIYQIDFYKNRKLQYLFATGNSLWLVDRLGRTVNGFPRRVPGKPIQFLSVIDFDNSKDYQFLIADAQGKIQVINKDGKVNLGWKEIEISHDLWVAPRPVRSNGKDYLIVIGKDGFVGAFNKKGKMIEGFPVDLKVRPSGDWTIEKLHGAELVTLVSEDGVLIQLDFDGKIINRNNLIKSSADSRFSLSKSDGNDRTVVSRVDKDRISVLTTGGEVLFDRQNPGSTEAYLTYFETDRGYRIFAFTDPLQEFTYYFNAKGESLLSNPLENQYRPAVLTEKGNVYFYGVNKNRIQALRRTLNP